MALNRGNRALLARLERALAAMDGRTREVFLMHRLGGLDYASIGERLGMPVGEVERRVAVALVQLSRALDGVGEPEGGG